MIRGLSLALNPFSGAAAIQNANVARAWAANLIGARHPPLSLPPANGCAVSSSTTTMRPPHLTTISGMISQMRRTRDKAASALPDIGREAIPDGQKRDFFVTIRDESGRLILAAQEHEPTEA